MLILDIIFRHRPNSTLERGGTRPGTSNVESIMEADENTHSPLVTPRLRTEADHKVVEVRETILNFHSVYAYNYILFLPRSQRFQVLEEW